MIMMTLMIMMIMMIMLIVMMMMIMINPMVAPGEGPPVPHVVGELPN